MATVNHTTTQAHDAQIIAGIKKNLQNVSNLPLAGSTYTMTSLVALIQSRLDAANAITNAKAGWHSAVLAYKAVNTQVTTVVRALREYVINVSGANSPMLADFGFTPPKKATLTPEQKTARAQKAAATRKARGTLGKKQKKAIRGTVPAAAPAATPATAPATLAPTAPATSTAPAPAGATTPTQPKA